MLNVEFYELNTIEDSKLEFAVIMSKYNEKWVYVKHKERDTWEIPGGHREKNECIEDAASRELFEETGAKKFKINPICIYSVKDSEDMKGKESFGQLFYAEIEEFQELPGYEIETRNLFENIPTKLTYPLIQPFLYKKVVEFIQK